MQQLTINNHTVAVTHPDKVIFPAEHITRKQLINYYRSVAPYMLPFLKDRALTIQRFPEGLAQEGFFQQHAFEHVPEWFETVSLPKKSGGNMQHILCQNEESLVYLVEHGMITPHRWLSKISQPDIPDTLVVDIDPPQDKFALAGKAAQIINQYFESKKLIAFLMTTGSKGLHVVVPIKPHYHFEYCRNFLKELLQPFIEEYTKEFTMEIRKEERAGRVFIDLLRNTYGHTAVAPYAVRALPGAPVATPIAWEELHDTTLSAQKYTVQNFADRLKASHNAWKNFGKVSQQALPG
jgi:bifunctional non-homologous end joining protein LigD